MNDSLLYHFNVVGIVDSIPVSSDSIVDSTKVTPVDVEFLGLDSLTVDPAMVHTSLNYDIITYVLLLLLGIIAIIWHFMPDRFSMIFSLKTEVNYSRLGDANNVVPGTIITGFFWLNFIISSGIFTFVIIKEYFKLSFINYSFFEIIGYIFIVFLGLLFYRTIIIYGTALVFQTTKMMKQQILTGRNIQFITGVFLLPVILLLLHTSGSLFIYIAIAVIAFLQIVRLVKIMIIGKSSTMFSVLHIILYLCTLEIVPVLVLIRLIGNASEV